MSRGDREVVVVERSGGTIKWLVLGAALGAGLALLFAPKNGKEIRRDLGRGLKNLREIADETLDELRGGAEEEDERGLRHANDSGGVYDDEETETEPEPEPEPEPVVTPKSRKAGAREELERRLAAARARRRSAIPDDEEPVA